MRTIITAFLAISCTCALSAQDENRSVQKSETEGSYFFRVHQKKGNSHVLMRCMNQVTTNNINDRFKGDLTTNIDEHSILHIDTHKRELTVEHTGEQREERQRVKALVGRLKQCLDIQDPPPPPAHKL